MSRHLDYRDKVAVVTGASSGFGRRLSVDLARQGAVVVCLARRADLLAKLEADLAAYGDAHSTHVCDVADAATFGELLGNVEDEHGRIDILVNNAGIEQLTPTGDGLTDAYRRIMETNFFGVVTGTLTVLPGMLARHFGVVVNVASDSARAPEPRHGAYSASKAAVAAFTESVAHEVAHEGVRVHVVYPAWMPTAMGMSFIEDGGKLPPRMVRRSEERVSTLLMDRMGGPRMEINAAFVPKLAPLSRIVYPRLYQWAMRRWASQAGAGGPL